MVYKFSIGQFQITPGDFEKNFSKAESLIRQAASQNCELIILPELWLGGYDYRNFDGYLAVCSNFLPEIEKLARTLKIAIVGTYPVRQKGKCFNSQIYYDSSGQVGHYEKIHLFSLMSEDKFFSPGDGLVTLNTPMGTTGLAICYDLRFPEIFRRYALQGAKVILISAEWPLSRIDHWKTLLRARAIENQLFLVGCNSVGESGKETMGGDSIVVDPWGRNLAEADLKTEGLITADLDLSEIQKARDSITVFKDRRIDIYG
jgi:omega-amidase